MNEITVLGKGDSEFDALVAATREAADSMQIEYDFQTVTEDTQIMMWGVTLTPALVVNDGVRVMGRVPTVEEIVNIISLCKQ